MLGRTVVSPPLLLAPMAGITDRDFRLLIRRLGGCGLVSMEFISAEGLLRGNPSTLRLLHFVEEERPIAIQIYGSDPARMAEAARLVEGMGANVCDINMGCPANKVLKGCAGAALTGDLPLARAIVRAVRAAITMPLTVKFRLGIHDAALTYLELGRIAEGEGASGVTLHARTARQQFSGVADWAHIARLRDALSIPVIGNGDVKCAEDALAMQRATGCDGVMIGRAALTNPWIFREAAAALAGRQLPPASLEERWQLIVDHFRELLARADERTALHKLKSFAGWYSHGLPDGRCLRRRLNDLASASELMTAVNEFFAAHLAHPAPHAQQSTPASVSLNGRTP